MSVVVVVMSKYYIILPNLQQLEKKSRKKDRKANTN